MSRNPRRIHDVKKAEHGCRYTTKLRIAKVRHSQRVNEVFLSLFGLLLVKKEPLSLHIALVVRQGLLSHVPMSQGCYSA